MKDIPVYLFTGFLESGKTKFIDDTLCDERFNAGERTLLILCEEGIEEYDVSRYPGKNVFIEVIEDKDDMSPALFASLVKKHKAERVIIEYNGMWLLSELYAALPREFVLNQEFCFVDSNTIMNYNANMRNLVFDKFQTAELIVFNRLQNDADFMPFHKLVRAVSRRADIAYEYKSGYVKYDDIEDPLPFDLNADVVEIADKDYALWFQDMMNDMNKYLGKTLKFKGIVARDGKIPDETFVVGRHVMTCCADDVQYCGIACDWSGARTLNTNDWVVVTVKFSVGNHKLYKSKGPILTACSVSRTSAPEEMIATFY